MKHIYIAVLHHSHYGSNPDASTNGLVIYCGEDAHVKAYYRMKPHAHSIWKKYWERCMSNRGIGRY